MSEHLPGDVVPNHVGDIARLNGFAIQSGSIHYERNVAFLTGERMHSRIWGVANMVYVDPLPFLDGLAVGDAITLAWTEAADTHMQVGADVTDVVRTKHAATGPYTGLEVSFRRVVGRNGEVVKDERD